MTIVSDVTNLLLDKTELEHVYAGRIPSQLLDKRGLDVVLVTSLKNTPDLSGGNRSQGVLQEIQLQLWVSPDSDIEELEWVINELLEEEGFHASWSSGYSIDEEIYQQKATIQYRRFLFKK